MLKKSLLVSGFITTAGVLINFTANAFSLPFFNSYNDNQNAFNSTYCEPGFYAGVQFGRGDTSYKPTDLTIPSTIGTTVSNVNISEIGLGGRIFAGYQFNPYFATEAGYTQFGKTTFTALGTTTINTSTPATFYTQYKGSITEHAADVVAKATMPIPGGFGAYIKGGAAYVSANPVLNANVTTAKGTAIISNTVSSQSYQAIRPTFGGGINYTVAGTPMSIDISWTRIQGSGAIPNADLAAVGIDYKFA